jgi:hypothetical protein
MAEQSVLDAAHLLLPYASKDLHRLHRTHAMVSMYTDVAAQLPSCRGNATAAVERATAVITSCITTFLGQFLASGVNLQNLQQLGDCQYPGQ